MQEEGKLLAETPYGPMILHTLARVYNLQADIYLGGRLLIVAGQEMVHASHGPDMCTTMKCRQIAEVSSI